MKNSDSAENSASPKVGLFRSASILSIGNLVSRVLGLLREMINARYFGTEGAMSAFVIASQVPTLVYDLLIGGMLSAALIPVLSEQARQKRSVEFTRLASVLITIFGTVLLLVVLILEISAPALATLLAGGFDKFDPQLLTLTTNLIRIVTPAIFFFGLAGLLTSILYSLQRFSFPALATAIYNVALVLAAPILQKWLGITSLAVGILAGSLAQCLIMAWDVRRASVAWHFSFNWQHPALRRILFLYLPNAVALLVSLFQVGLDRRLASGAGERSIAWMRYATTLQQLPLGLISVAIAMASLPQLSQYFAAGDDEGYRQTLGRGLRLVLLFIAPATVILWLLGEPIARVLFVGMKFRVEDSLEVTDALSIYLIGMIFAAVDFPLNYAFYARNNSLLPAIVGIISVLIYVGVALWTLPRLGYLGLVWSDTAKQIGHALIMLSALWWRVGRLNAQTILSSAKVATASACMGFVIYISNPYLSVWDNGSRISTLISVIIAAGIGTCVYLVILLLLQSEDLFLLKTQLQRRLGAQSPQT